MSQLLFVHICGDVSDGREQKGVNHCINKTAGSPTLRLSRLKEGKVTHVAVRNRLNQITV